MDTLRVPINQLEHEKFVPTQADPNRPGVVVVNPDGSSIGGAPAGPTQAVLYDSEGNPLNTSGGNLVVNVGNMAQGTFGNQDNINPGIFSSLQFSENLVYNPKTDSWDRKTEIQGNGTVTLTQTDNVVASTKTLTKVINGVTYTRTLSYNAAGDFLSVSAWS